MILSIGGCDLDALQAIVDGSTTIVLGSDLEIELIHVSAGFKKLTIVLISKLT
jgi:hypothetical protein